MAVVLVLGGNGFIGRQVCKEALKLGHTVYSLSRSGPPQAAIPGVKWLKGDATDTSSYPPQADIIVHSIGTLVEKPGLSYKKASYDTTMAMLEYAVDKQASVRYVSADDFKGLASWFLPNYFLWKRKAEREVQTRLPGNHVIVRPALVTGWDRWPTVIVGWVNDLFSFVSAGVIPRSIRADQLARNLLQQ